jgi:uncharacterized repeat protein (TIGR01451 family)
LTPITPNDLDVIVPDHVQVDRSGDATFDITVDARRVPVGETRFATIEFKQGNQTLTFPVTIVRQQPVVTMEKSCDPALIARGETTECTITIQNTSFDEAAVSVQDQLPQELKLINGSVVGADANRNLVTYEGTLYGAAPPIVNVAVDPLASPFGYVGLGGFGSSTVVSASDESITNFNVNPFIYAGETYSRIGIVSNGYIIVGGGTGADVDYINSDLPDEAIPNNVLAPFWTDLNPSNGGRILINVLGISPNYWIIVEWESVPNWGDGETNTAQVWIGINGVEDISFTYGPDVSDGDGGFLTVGAENKYGNSGGTVYFNGTGAAPAPSYPDGDYEVDVFSTPGAPGETHVITFSAKGDKIGEWMNCAEMTSPLYQGVNTACFFGEVTR